MVECQNCLTNVAGLCSSCKKCAICCEENKCFGCNAIYDTLIELGIHEKTVMEIKEKTMKDYRE